MTQWFSSSFRVALGFALGTAFGWGLGQHLQDLCAPDLIRPALNAPDQVASFLRALPPTAHAARLLASGSGMVLGILVMRRIGGSSKSESFALGALFLLACLMDLIRIPHGLTLSLLTLATSFTAVWIGIATTLTDEP